MTAYVSNPTTLDGTLGVYCTDELTNWTPNGVPGSGDTWEIRRDLGHQLHVKSGVTFVVGDPAAYSATAGVLTGSAGSTTPGLVLRSGSIIQLFGGIQQNNASVEVHGGASIWFDSGSHATAVHWQPSTANSQANAIVYSPTSGTGVPNWTDSIAIEGRVNGVLDTQLRGHRFPNGAFQRGGIIRLQYLRLRWMGGTGAAAAIFLPNCSNGSDIAYLEYVDAQNCGPVGLSLGNIATNARWWVKWATIKNTPGSVSTSAPTLGTNGSAAVGTGERTFEGIRIDRPLQLWGPGMTLKNWFVDLGTANVGAFATTSSTTFVELGVGGWRNGSTAAVSVIPYGTTQAAAVGPVYGITQGASNPRWFQIGSGNPSATQDTWIPPLIIQRFGGNFAGDPLYFSGTPTADQTAKIRRLLVLPNGLNKQQQTSKVTNVLNMSTRVFYDVEHATFVTSEISETGIAAGESQTAPIGQVFVAARSSVAIRPTTATNGAYFRREHTFKQQDLLAASTSGHSVLVSVAGMTSDGLNPTGYYGYDGAANNALVTTGTLGTTNLELLLANPYDALVDNRAVDLADYTSDTIGDQGGAQANLDKFIVEAFKLNDASGYNTAFDLATAYTWVFDKWALSPVTASAARTMAHDGTTPGVTQMPAASGGLTTTMRQNFIN